MVIGYKALADPTALYWFLYIFWKHTQWRWLLLNHCWNGLSSFYLLLMRLWLLVDLTWKTRWLNGKVEVTFAPDDRIL